DARNRDAYLLPIRAHVGMDGDAEPEWLLRHVSLVRSPSFRGDGNMAKPLSEKLSDLSVRAKNAEDSIAAAKKEAHDKIMARREDARAAAQTAVEKVDRDIKSVGDTATAKWSAVQAKITADMDALKAKVSKQKHNLDARVAENRAEELEWEADCAVDYAIASVEQARLAVLDAIVGRVEAQEMSRS